MDVFNNLWVISECLLDEERTSAFEKAIKKTVKKGDIVVDAGTGSAILAMMAAQAGAKKVYALEIAEDLVEFAKSNIIKNKLENIIEVITTDVADFKLPHAKAVDVCIMEMMDTGLVSEHQARCMHGLRKNGVIDQQTKLIPHKVKCALEVVNYDFNFHGLNMEFILAARNFSTTQRIKHILSETITYTEIDFKYIEDLEINKQIAVPILKSGTVNAIHLKTQTFFPTFSIWGTSDMNMPVIIPLEPKKVKRGDTINIHVKYKMGEGFTNFSSRIID